MCICITVETKAFVPGGAGGEGHNGGVSLWWNDGLLLEEDLMDWTAVEAEKDSSMDWIAVSSMSHGRSLC
jgi:hypothetical protein